MKRNRQSKRLCESKKKAGWVSPWRFVVQKDVFTFIRDRLHNRINSWTAKFLSKGGKEIFIKSVAQALPTYLLPQEILNKLKSVIAKLRWSANHNNKDLHWMAWDKICKPVEKGGLGFRDPKNFNLALLAKQLWHLLHHLTSLLARVFKGWYYRYTNPLEISSSNSPSYGWNSMLVARDLLERTTTHDRIGAQYPCMVWSVDLSGSQPSHLSVLGIMAHGEIQSYILIIL